ncbi:MAG TPA: hypothetical protein VEY67_02385, partial [Candidatus Dormibacteraeota bacterium]|nr:hypothetical protein [Candidatus Dormibacteraeota bacterium]
LELADGHARAGREDAALDACAAAIGLGPADPPLHLTLAAIYLDRGWRALAVEKLALLGRLADLEGDEATRARVRDLLASRVPDAPAGHEETGAGVSEAG